MKCELHGIFKGHSWDKTLAVEIKVQPNHFLIQKSFKIPVKKIMFDKFLKQLKSQPENPFIKITIETIE